MRRNLSSVVLLLALASYGAGAAAQGARQPSSSDSQPSSADAVVRELYTVHRDGYGPIFEGKSRRQLDRFFGRQLADAVWTELTRQPSDEVGNLDFDPLYNAQDILISGFRVGRPVTEGRGAYVLVSFSNAGRRERIKFLMREAEGGWKIENLVYGDGSDLLKILNRPR